MEEKEMLEGKVSTEEIVEESPATDAPAFEEEEIVEAAEGAGKTETPKGTKRSKKKKILNGVFLGFQILLVLLSIIICLIVIINPKSEDVSSAGVKLLPVLSNSMNGNQKDSFKKGDLIVATTPKNGGKNLKIGDIVTFKGNVDGKQELITHRIVDIARFDDVVKYQTKGDANGDPDAVWKTADEIKAVYSFHIKGLGKVMTWIRDGYHFIFVIIIPLGVLLIYNIYLVAQIIVEGKMKKAKALAAENAKKAALASIDEEEIKRKAIEEYLKAQAAAEAAQGKDKGESE